MEEKVANSIPQTIRELIRRVLRFAPVILCAWAATIVVFILIGMHDIQSEEILVSFLRVIFALIFGTFFALCATFVAQQLRERFADKARAVTVLSWCVWAALLAVYYISLQSFTFDAFGEPSVIHLIRFLALTCTAITGSISMPFALRHRGDELFALDLIKRFFFTGALCAALSAGFIFVFVMLQFLLEFTVPDSAFFQIVVLCTGIFGVPFFVSGISEQPRELISQPIAPLWRILFGYVLPIFLVVYTALVYVYLVRIVVVGEMPSNMLVNLVLWYSAAGVMALYFLRSVSEYSRIHRLFDRWYCAATLIPLALMFAGLGIRIATYGWTINRYFVGAFGVWIAVCTVYYLVKSPSKRYNLVVPALFCVIAFCSVVGPWNAFAVTNNSQVHRLEVLLERNEMFDDNHQLRASSGSTRVSDEDAAGIYSAVEYLAEYDLLGSQAFITPPYDSSTLESRLGFPKPTSELEPIE